MIQLEEEKKNSENIILENSIRKMYFERYYIHFKICYKNYIA